MAVFEALKIGMVAATMFGGPAQPPLIPDSRPGLGQGIQNAYKGVDPCDVLAFGFAKGPDGRIYGSNNRGYNPSTNVYAGMYPDGAVKFTVRLPKIPEECRSQIPYRDVGVSLTDKEGRSTGTGIPLETTGLGCSRASLPTCFTDIYPKKPLPNARASRLVLRVCTTVEYRNPNSGRSAIPVPRTICGNRDLKPYPIRYYSTLAKQETTRNALDL